MKKFKNVVLKVMVIIFIFLVAFIVVQKSLFLEHNEKEEKIKETLKEEMIDSEVEVEKKLLDEDVEKSKRFVESMSSKTQIVLLEETGSYVVKHDKTPNDNSLTEWLVNSEIQIKINYTAILTIKTSDLDFINDENGKLLVNYNSDDIVVSSININKIIPIKNESIFGKEYTPEEVSALTLLLTDKVKEEMQNDELLKLRANESFKSFLTNMAWKFKVFSISVVNVKQ